MCLLSVTFIHSLFQSLSGFCQLKAQVSVQLRNFHLLFFCNHLHRLWCLHTLLAFLCLFIFILSIFYLLLLYCGGFLHFFSLLVTWSSAMPVSLDGPCNFSFWQLVFLISKNLVSFPSMGVYFLITDLLRFNLHTIKSIPFKFTTQYLLIQFSTIQYIQNCGTISTM